MNYKIDVCSGTIFDKRHPMLDNIPVKIVSRDKFYVQYNKIFRISVDGSFKQFINSSQTFPVTV